MRLVVAIVNYRTASLVVDCLRSLAPEIAQLRGAHVVVVDNASGDGSERVLAEAIARNGWSGWATFKPAPLNGGFSYGNNRAIEDFVGRLDADRPEYVLLLNPDTLVRAGALHVLLDFMDRHPDVGIAGGGLEDPDGTPQHCRFRFPSILGELESTLQVGAVSRLLARHKVAPPLTHEAHPIDWVAGASMIVRTSVFDAIGLMDEDYFLYYEEVDFTLRAAHAGFRCWWVPESRIVHLVGQSTGVTVRDARPGRRPRYWFESRWRYFVKHHGRAYATAASVAWMLGQVGHEMIRVLRRRPSLGPPCLLRDFVRYTFGKRRTADRQRRASAPPQERIAA
jgi:GT2 family glycosyltransferase